VRSPRPRLVGQQTAAFTAAALPLCRTV